jgi:hypothetical protein
LQSDRDRQQRDGQGQEMKRLFSTATPCDVPQDPVDQRESRGNRRVRCCADRFDQEIGGGIRGQSIHMQQDDVRGDEAAPLSKRGLEKASEIEYVHSGPDRQACSQPDATAVRNAPEQQWSGDGEPEGEAHP